MKKKEKKNEEHCNEWLGAINKLWWAHTEQGFINVPLEWENSLREYMKLLGNKQWVKEFPLTSWF